MIVCAGVEVGQGQEFADDAVEEINVTTTAAAGPIGGEGDQPAILGQRWLGVHLRRVAYTFAKVFRKVPVEFCYCPVPSHFGFVRQDGWWTRREDRRFVLSEMIKLAGYLVILSMPAWASRRLFRLKD